MWLAATVLRDGRVLVVGGTAAAPAMPGSFGTTLASAEIFDPASGTWAATGGLIDGRYMHTATLLRDGRVLVAGVGELAEGRDQVPAEIFEPETGTWSETRPMFGRSQPLATLLGGGRVLVVGGGSSHGILLATAEVFDPATGSWTATASMTEVRHWMTATLLLDGSVLVAGGDDEHGDTTLASAELYYPGGGG